MANGIQSLLNPDKKKRKYPFEGRYPYRDSFPDTLPTAQFQELLGDVQAVGGAKDWNQPQTIPAELLLPVMDSLTALVQSNNPDEKMARVMDEQELLDFHREKTPDRWPRDLVPIGLKGAYNRTDEEIWLNQPELYGLISPRVLPESRQTAIHEVMHHLQQVAGRDPELRETFYGKAPYILAGHGPEAFTANTLEAAWDALASLSDDGVAIKKDVIDYMVENYPLYDSGSQANESRVLPKDLADKTVTWLADQDPFKTELRELTLGEKFKRGILSLLGRNR